MTEDCNVLSLGLLAETLCQPGGYEPQQLRCLSREGPDPVSSLIESILSSDEGRMKKELSGLADCLSGQISVAAWFNLGRLAA
ncbi:MAG: hypothetical protein PHW87_11935, partial [Methanothrix sp.]|nr:hypothetical protein [Methanothrix sp.]MDD4163177.1 hypothetical protein [Methanothrix sp.]